MENTTTTTCFHVQSPLLSIKSLSSLVFVAPVSLFKVPMKSCRGLHWLLLPCVGSQSTRLLALSSGCRWQCPASCSLLELILLLTAGRVPYNSLLVMCELQWMFCAFLSILVYVPSRASVSVQLSQP